MVWYIIVWYNTAWYSAVEMYGSYTLALKAKAKGIPEKPWVLVGAFCLRSLAGPQRRAAGENSASDLGRDPGSGQSRDDEELLEVALGFL